LRSSCRRFRLPNPRSTPSRSLEALGALHSFLVFPGEGHSLDKNPWHGYIKLREELNWLEKYDGSVDDRADLPQSR